MAGQWKCSARCPLCHKPCTIERIYHEGGGHCEKPMWHEHLDEPMRPHQWSLGLSWHQVAYDAQVRGLFEGPSGNADPEKRAEEEAERDKRKAEEEAAIRDKEEEVEDFWRPESEGWAKGAKAGEE